MIQKKLLLESVGFREVEVIPVKHTHKARSAREFMLSLKETASGALGGANNKLDKNTLFQIQEVINERFKQFEGEEGLKITSESLLIVGRKV